MAWGRDVVLVYRGFMIFVCLLNGCSMGKMIFTILFSFWVKICDFCRDTAQGDHTLDVTT